MGAFILRKISLNIRPLFAPSLRNLEISTTQNVFIFRVIRVRIQFKYGKTRTRLTPNTNTFHAVIVRSFFLWTKKNMFSPWHFDIISFLFIENSRYVLQTINILSDCAGMEFLTTLQKQLPGGVLQRCF